MDTRASVILFVLLCILPFLISAEDKKPSCFLRDRSVIGRYVNAGNCTCTEARQRALGRGNPSEFVPVCKENGKFARMQTGQGTIATFCVDEDFRLVGFGPALCRHISERDPTAMDAS